jgi:hypothetical protein
MTQTPEISAAADLCRAAFKAFPNATHAWCCHHDVLCEPLIESFENRIAFILSDKAESERVVRLNNFRPVQDAEKFEALHTKYVAGCKPLDDKYGADLKPLWDKYLADRKALNDKFKADLKPLDDKYWADRKALGDKYEADRKPLYDKYLADCKPLHEPLMELYRHDVPMGTWNGVSIFGK